VYAAIPKSKPKKLHQDPNQCNDGYTRVLYSGRTKLNQGVQHLAMVDNFICDILHLLVSDRAGERKGARDTRIAAGNEMGVVF
jgi:hypothetical protein